MARELGTIGVVGLGTMGAGIAEVFARAGLSVVAVDVDPAAVDRGRGHVQRSTGRAVDRGRLTEQAQGELLARIRFADRLEELAPCDLVVEAVPERVDLKVDVFGRFDAIVGPDVVLATNTSSLSVTAIAAATAHPGRVVGMHFFNPAPVLKLVEVIRTVTTDPGVVRDVVALAERLGKKPVVVGGYQAEFIGNALLFGYLNRAASMVESGYARREDIDLAMRLGCGLPMGPLALLDLIGLDVAQEILATMYRQGRDRLHTPSPALTQLVTAGFLGRKSGRGFYTYAGPGSGAVVDDALTPAPASPVRAASGAGEPGTDAVRTVGVVGSGGYPADVADLLTASGYDVTSVPDAAGLAGVAEVDLVIEAVADEPAAKRAVFADLDRICRPGTLLASTSSSVPVVTCAAATGRPREVLGLHFVNPASADGLVEVVRAVGTADRTVDAAADLCRRAGRQPVVCGDRAGLIVDALLFPYLNDAVKMLAAGYASADDVDTAMKSGCGYPAGPFEVLDTIGLDVALRVQRALYWESREPGLAPAPLLDQLVIAGQRFRT
jgi:3-hydroxybutyryl-CoA dehydrogenase